MKLQWIQLLEDQAVESQWEKRITQVSVIRDLRGRKEIKHKYIPGRDGKATIASEIGQF